MKNLRIGRRAVALLCPFLLAGMLVGCEREPQALPEPEAAPEVPEPLLERISFPGGNGSGQARLTRGIDGQPLLSWIENAGEQDRLRYSRYSAAGFGTPEEVVSSDRMFVNWADFPSVTPITESLWFAHWLRLQPDSFGAYDIATEISTDGGHSWSAAEQMNEDQTEAEHGFVSAFAWNEQIAAFWLDGRELANWSFDNPDALLGVSLRLALYGPDGDVLRREITDDLVCDCCQPDVAMTGSGPIVVYRDRTEAEIRDVVVRRYVAGSWSEAVGLGNEGWHIEGCPVNGPVITARGDRVAAAWFTAANARSRVRFALSEDGGATFADAIDVATQRALGQAAIVLDDDGRVLVSWWRRAEEGGIDLMVRSFPRGAEGSEPLRIAHEDVGQPVDVPQMIDSGDSYLIAWSSFDDDGTVRLARFDFPH